MKVFFASPIFSLDGPYKDRFRECLRQSCALLEANGIDSTINIEVGCIYIEVARNKLVRNFLAQEEYTDFVFLDYDLTWKPEDLLRLLSVDVDIVGGVYPFKIPVESYPARLRTESGTTAVLTEQGLIDAWLVPTGFMRIRRQAFEAIHRYYGESLIIDEYDMNDRFSQRYFNFFNTEKIGRKFWGEDWNFCRKWTMEMEQHLWVMPDIDIIHWAGDKPHHGNYHNWLLKGPDFLRTSGKD